MPENFQKQTQRIAIAMAQRFGVTRINFDPDKQPSVTYRYQLDNQELSELALKGLFGTLDENGQVQDASC